MGRVSQETLGKLNAFIASLPVEAKKKCALCNETLTHIVKQAEAQTGAGTRTVCRVLAESHNDGAAPMDVVSGAKLDDRVRTKEKGRRVAAGEVISAQCQNNPPPSPNEGQAFGAMQYAIMALNHLDKIKDNDLEAESALLRVMKWVNERLEKMPMKKKK